jgi:hypothetical protein
MDRLKEIEKDAVFGVGSCLIVLFLTVAAISLSGCFAGEVYMGTRRIDEVHQTQVMKDKSLRCLFVECGGGQNGK